MLGAENLGGSPGSAEGAAKLSLWFHDEDVLLDVHHGGLTLTYGTGEYISTEGEKFALVLDENLPGDFLSDEALLVERTLRYLGTNTEGQTSEFHVALSLCRSMSMCLL